MEENKNIEKGNFSAKKRFGYNLLVAILPFISAVASIYACHLHERRFVYEGDTYDERMSNIAMYLFFLCVFFIFGNILQGFLSWFRFFKDSVLFMRICSCWKFLVLWSSIFILVWSL